jgi:GldM C-terminal domain
MRIIFLLLLPCFSIGANAQVQVLNRSLTDSTLPYLYIGVDNAIEVEWNGLKPEEHSISISGAGGSIMKVGENRFIVRVSNVTDECVVCISNKNGKIKFKQSYKARLVEYTPLSLGEIESGATTTKENIVANPFLIFKCNGCYYNPRIQIVSFVLTVDINEQIVEVPGTGNQLSEKQITLVKKANDILTIDNIRAISPEGKNVRLPSIVIYIKKEHQ